MPQNINLSPDEYKEVIKESFLKYRPPFDEIPKGFPKIAVSLYGYPVYLSGGAFIVFVKCAYCGENSGIDKRGCCSRCGAPLSGVSLAQRAQGTSVLSAIYEALFASD